MRAFFFLDDRKMADAYKTIEEGLGPFLRREREERGFSLGYVANQTRIQTFYLERIEGGEFHRLPAGQIGCGFVRAYAVAIGVDPDAAALQFDRETGGRRGEPEAVPLANPIGLLEAASHRGVAKPFVSVIAVAVFIIGSGALLWFIQGKTERLFPVSGFAQRIKAVMGLNVSSGPASNAAKLGDGPLVLKVYTREDTWLRVIVDKREKEEILLMAGDERHWRGSEKFILTVGNASGIQVFLNGMKIPLPQKSSDVLRDFVVSAKLLN